MQQPDHWAFAGTGLRRGDRFGARTSPPLVGYECDGAPLEWIDPQNLPARACIEARMATPGCLVEIMAIAVKKSAGADNRARS